MDARLATMETGGKESEAVAVPVCASSPENQSIMTDSMNTNAFQDSLRETVSQQVASIIQSVVGEENTLEIGGVLTVSTVSNGELRIPIHHTPTEPGSPLNSTASPTAFDGSLSSGETAADVFPGKDFNNIHGRNKRKNTKPVRVDPAGKNHEVNIRENIPKAEGGNLLYPSPGQDTPLDLCVHSKKRPDSAFVDSLREMLTSASMPRMATPLSFPFSFFPMFNTPVSDTLAAMQRPYPPLLNTDFVANQLTRSNSAAETASKFPEQISPNANANVPHTTQNHKSEISQKVKRIRNASNYAGGNRAKRNGSTKSFRCNQCSKTFPSLAMLSKHTYGAHSAFRCMICGSNFTQRSNLQRHSLKHVGFKPFICNICGREYYRKDHLVRHIELTHPGHDPRTNITSKLSSSESLDYLDRRDGRLPAQRSASSPAASSCYEDQPERRMEVEIHTNALLPNPSVPVALTAEENDMPRCASPPVEVMCV